MSIGSNDAVEDTVYARAAEIVQSSLRRPRLERQSSFKEAVSQLEAVELEMLAAGMRQEAYRRKQLSTYVKLGLFPDADSLRDPHALVTFLGMLDNGPITPTEQYKLALRNPAAVAERMRRHCPEQWKLVEDIARQLKRYETRSVDYRSGFERVDLESVQAQLVPLLIHPSADMNGAVPAHELAQATIYVKTLFATVEKYDKRHAELEPQVKVVDAGTDPEQKSESLCALLSILKAKSRVHHPAIEIGNTGGSEHLQTGISSTDDQLNLNSQARRPASGVASAGEFEHLHTGVDRTDERHLVEAWEDFGQQVVKQLVRHKSASSGGGTTEASPDAGATSIELVRHESASGGGGTAEASPDAGATSMTMRPHPPVEREMLQCSRVNLKLKAKDSHLQSVCKHRVHRFHPHRPSHRLPRMPPLSPPVDAVAAPSRGTLFDARVTHQQSNENASESTVQHGQCSASAREARYSEMMTPKTPVLRSISHRQQQDNFGEGDGHVIEDTFANRSKYRRLRKAGGVADTFDPYEAFVRQPNTVGGLEIAAEVTIGGALAPAARLPDPRRPSVKQQLQRQQASRHEGVQVRFPAISGADAYAYRTAMKPVATADTTPAPATGTASPTGAANLKDAVVLAHVVGADDGRHTIQSTVVAMAVYPIPPGPSRGFPVGGLPRTPRGPLF